MIVCWAVSAAKIPVTYSQYCAFCEDTNSGLKLLLSLCSLCRHCVVWALTSWLQRHICYSSKTAVVFLEKLFDLIVLPKLILNKATKEKIEIPKKILKIKPTAEFTTRQPSIKALCTISWDPADPLFKSKAAVVQSLHCWKCKFSENLIVRRGLTSMIYDITISLEANLCRITLFVGKKTKKHIRSTFVSQNKMIYIHVRACLEGIFNICSIMCQETHSSYRKLSPVTCIKNQTCIHYCFLTCCSLNRQYSWRDIPFNQQAWSQVINNPFIIKTSCHFHPKKLLFRR